MLMHMLCAANAIKDPDRDALIFETGERQTWAELDQKAERIANALSNAGVQKGDRVSCLAKNCMEAIQIFFGCNKIGALYAPINYRFAVPEILRVLMDSEPKVVISQEEYRDAINAIRGSEGMDFVCEWLSIGAGSEKHDDFEGWVSNAPQRDYFPQIYETDPSWICYTGGTTGRPKGVVLSHKNMMAGAINFIITCGITRGDVYFVAGALFHIALAVPIAYWLAGAKTVLANFEPAKSLDVISREGVTQMVCTGTIFKMLVDEMELNPRPTKMELMFCGGAPVSPQLVARAYKAFGCGVSQIYGQTEVTLMGTYLYPEDYEAGFTAAPDTHEARRLNSVGRAAPLCVARIVDEQMNPQPPGQVGEIVFMGDAVMLGYANMPEETADTVKDGWLRTGDLGYMDEDGYVYLVDRKKDMIVTGGENVYSSEVELVLAQHPDVSEAVVIGIPDDHWGEVVLALVVPLNDRVPDVDHIREFCRKKLAGYKVPKRVEFRDVFPRLPTGKIAKGQLRDEFWAGHERRIHGT